MQTASNIPGNIFADLGLAELPDERKVQLLEKMNDLVHKRLMVRIDQLLTPEQKAELDTIGEGNPEKAGEKMAQFVPNIGELMIAEVDRLKGEMRAMNLSEQIDGV